MLTYLLRSYISDPLNCVTVREKTRLTLPPPPFPLPRPSQKPQASAGNIRQTPILYWTYCMGPISHWMNKILGESPSSGHKRPSPSPSSPVVNALLLLSCTRDGDCDEIFILAVYLRRLRPPPLLQRHAEGFLEGGGKERQGTQDNRQGRTNFSRDN